MDSRSRVPIVPLLAAGTCVVLVALMLMSKRARQPVVVPPEVVPPSTGILMLSPPAPRILVTQPQLEADRIAMADAVARSHSSGYSLVVDKSAYRLLAFRRGELCARFPVELGPDPVNAKERMGDGRTPEGAYRVVARKDWGRTDFYRALLINYPNTHDRRMGRTGGALEIHGYGSGMSPDSGGSNWTAGCVALSNDHMDSLFALGDGTDRIDTGTPVTIVYAGSMADSCYAVVE